MKTARQRPCRTDFSPLPMPENWHASKPVHRMRKGLTPSEYGPRVARPHMARIDALPINKRVMAHIFGLLPCLALGFNIKRLIARHPHSWRDTEAAFRLLAQQSSHGVEAIRPNNSRIEDLV